MIVVRNGKLLINDDIIEASLIIEEHIIKAMVKDEKPFIHKAEKIIDAHGLPIIPGGIDIHAHIYDPDYTHHEDWETGTKAAVFGGITTVYDMPLRMFVDNIDKLMIKVKEGLRHSYTNFAIHAGMIRDDNYKAIQTLAANGVIGFKIFTLKPWRASDRALLEILKMIKEVNGVAIIHAEDNVLIDFGLSKVRHRHDPLAHHEARSDFAEAAAIAKVGFYGKTVGAHVHIAHVTSKIGSDIIRFLKEREIAITAETCPQYLYFTRDDVEKYGNYLKIAPSLKTRSDVNSLWEAIKTGVIDAIASDHAPSPRSEKEVDVWKAWGGIPVIELIIPFTFTFGVKSGRISFRKFIDVVSTNPAKIMKIYPKKGSIAIGSDADIVVLDINDCRKIDASKLHHKVDWCPFEGVEMCGWPLHVLVYGNIVVENKELVAKPGIGEYLGEYYKKLYERTMLSR